MLCHHTNNFSMSRLLIRGCALVKMAAGKKCEKTLINISTGVYWYSLNTTKGEAVKAEAKGFKWRAAGNNKGQKSSPYYTDEHLHLMTSPRQLKPTKDSPPSYSRENNVPHQHQYLTVITLRSQTTTKGVPMWAGASVAWCNVMWLVLLYTQFALALWCSLPGGSIRDATDGQSRITDWGPSRHLTSLLSGLLHVFPRPYMPGWIIYAYFSKVWMP